MDTDRALLSNLMLSRTGIERAAQLRGSDSWQRERRADPSSRVIRVAAGRAELNGDSLRMRSAVEVTGAELTFLGIDEDDVAYFSEHLGEPGDGDWSDLRGVGASLSDLEAGLMVTAVALDNWMRAHVRCPRCGEPTEFNAAGWTRRCPADGSEHFPRTDPAVIVLVRDRADRALLGRQSAWERGWFSTLAGFVEAGESAEAAVRREVFEESGVRIATGVDDIWYLGSQPWPFPCSLMLGYHAWADDPSINVDGEEITEARWFSREELADACGRGEVRLPPAISIARRLVERWFGEELPGAWSRSLPRG